MPVRYVCDRCGAVSPDAVVDTHDLYTFTAEEKIVTETRSYASKFAAPEVTERPSRAGWISWARFQIPEQWRVVKGGPCRSPLPGVSRRSEPDSMIGWILRFGLTGERRKRR